MDEIISLKLNIINYIIFKYSTKDLIETFSEKVPKIFKLYKFILLKFKKVIFYLIFKKDIQGL